MTTIIGDGGVERYDDLHIDLIDPQWKPKSAWVNGGLEAFHAAIELRDIRQLPFAVGLGLSIKAGDRIGERGTASSSDLQAQLDTAPPSLYLFPAGHDASKELDCAVRDGEVESDAISQQITFAEDEAIPCCYYLKFRRTGTSDYRRSIFFLGQSALTENKFQ